MSRLSSDAFNAEMGRRLEAVRQLSELTQTAFAERLGVTQRAYANYERGERELPSFLLRTISETFQIDPLWLLVGPGESPIALRSKYLDSSLLKSIFELIDGWLDSNHRIMDPSKKALVVKLAYEHCMESGIVDSSHLRSMLALAA